MANSVRHGKLSAFATTGVGITGKGTARLTFDNLAAAALECDLGDGDAMPMGFALGALRDISTQSTKVLPTMASGAGGDQVDRKRLGAETGAGPIRAAGCSADPSEPVADVGASSGDSGLSMMIDQQLAQSRPLLY